MINLFTLTILTIISWSFSLCHAGQTLKTNAHLSSPLCKEVLFLDTANKDYVSFKKLLIKLESVQTAVSDLERVRNIDFYFHDSTNQIEYSDRHSFEASLNPTYDAMGTIALPENQSDVLWMHEMGHAILDAQLAKDFPWYQKRSEIMKKWGAAVTNSTKLEIANRTEKNQNIRKQNERKLQKLSAEIQFYIRKVATLPNAREIEELIAPYHEFFADVVAVIYTMDGKALSKALANPLDPMGDNATPEEKQELIVRDYSFLRDANTWQETEPHAVLTPTLSLIWGQIQNLNPNRKTKQKILRIIYSAIRDELLERSKNKNLWQLSPAEINIRLIHRINSI